MARLSVEHHPEGPGDQYGRKKKSHKRTRSTASSKREASPLSQTPKRAKRAQVDDHEQIAREMEDSVSRSQDAEAKTAVAVATSKGRRRNSEPPTAHNDNDDAEAGAVHPASQPAPRVGRLPKPQRNSRMSMPAQLPTTDEGEEESNEVQFEPLRAQLDPRTHRRLRRSHLSEEVNEFEEHKKEDSKRVKELSELRRQLHEQDEHIKNLEFNLEASRMGGIDVSDETTELEEKLRRAKEENAQLRASMAFTPTPSPLDNPEDFDGEGFIDDDDTFGPFYAEDDDVEADAMSNKSQPTKSHTSRTFISSQVTLEESSQALLDYDTLAEVSQVDPTSVPDKVSDQAVKRYEMEIEQIKTQLSQTESIVRLVGINMQNLQILPAGATNDDILTELRHTFELARGELEKLFPGSTAELTNGDLVPTLLSHLRKMTVFIKEKVTRLQEYKEEVQVLQGDKTSALEQLSASENRILDLEQKLQQVDRNNEQNERRVVELEEEISKQQEMIANQEIQINEKDFKVHGLEDELDDKDTDLERLRDAYKKAEDDVNKLTRTITVLEEDYATKIAQMEEDHAEAIAELQGELEDEKEARANAEGDAAQKSDYIDELQDRIDGMSTTIDEVKSDIDRLQQLYSTESIAREAAEKTRDEQADLLDKNASTIENLSETIRQLENHIQGLSANLDAERKQREQAEAELDDRNQELVNLNTNLHDAGIKANELRSKLFELQQQKEQELNDLEAQAKTTEDELREHLDAETKDRRDAEEQVANLEDQVAQLQNNLQETEDSLIDMTSKRDELEIERDAQVAKLHGQNDDLDKKITALEAAHKTTLDGLQTTIVDLNNEISVQKLRIQELEEAADVTAEHHTDEITQRDTAIADLEGELDTMREENETLKEENTSLAKRVENEASELLNLMGNHAEEANALRKTIDIQKATIKNFEDAAKQRIKDHEKDVANLKAEIEELRIVATTRAEHIATLVTYRDELEATFRAREEENQKTIDMLNESLRQLLAQNEQIAEQNRQKHDVAIDRLHQMKAEGLEIKSKATDIHKVTTGKVTKVSEKVKIGKKKAGRGKVTKRQWGDSGIGFDDAFEGEGDGMMAEMEDEGVVG